MPTRTSPVACTTWLLCSCRVSPSMPAGPQARFGGLFFITYLLRVWRTYWPCGPQTRKITLPWNCRMGRSGSSQDVAGPGGRTSHTWTTSPVATGSTTLALMAMCMTKANGEILWWKTWTWSANGNGTHTWSSPCLYLACCWDQLFLATFLTGKNEIFSTVARCRIRFSVWVSWWDRASCPKLQFLSHTLSKVQPPAGPSLRSAELHCVKTPHRAACLGMDAARAADQLCLLGNLTRSPVSES